MEAAAAVEGRVRPAGAVELAALESARGADAGGVPVRPAAREHPVAREHAQFAGELRVKKVRRLRVRRVMVPAQTRSSTVGKCRGWRDGVEWDMKTHDDKESAFVEAAFQGDLVKVQRLLDQGVDVNQADGYGTTALHWACENGNVGMVALLLARGADVNLRDAGGDDAFYLAGDSGQSTIMAMLWRAGVERERYPLYAPPDD